MKKTFLLLIISFLLIACNSDEETNFEQLPNSAYKLIRIQQFDSSNNLVQDLNYTYDALFRLIVATDENMSFFYKYNSNGELTSFCNVNNIPITTYTYNDNLVSSFIGNSIRSELSYNDLNQLISIKAYDIYTNDFLREDTNTFDNENNVINSTNQANGNSITKHYDSMKNPTSLLFNNEFLKALSIGNNNVTQTTISDDPNYIELREYEYNNENFPSVERIYVNGIIDRTNFYTYDTLTN